MLINIFAVLTLGYFSILTGACNTGDADGSGVELLGTYYKCKYLRDYYEEDKYIGIYKARRFHCGMPYTDCCQTCNKILSCKDAPYNGIYLAERYYRCSLLQQYHPDDEKVGIYKNRKFICNQTTTDCCESCEKVFAESDISTTPSEPATTTTTTTITTTTPITVAPEEYIDTCDDGCLWVADGSYGKCSWLLDPSRSAYKMRKTLCNGLAPGCKKTCHIIAMESENTGQTDRGSTVTTLAPVCKDTFLMVKKMTYPCSDLLNPNSNIYNDRQALCSSDDGACCVTCQRVNNEKPAAVIKYSDQNMIDKNGIVIETVPSAANTNRYQGNSVQSAYHVPSSSAQKKQSPQQLSPKKAVVSFYDIIKGSLDKMQKEEQSRRNIFTSFMSNILSTFKRLQQKM